MRTHGRVVSEDALTRTLDHWLTDGPREMPDEVLADALRAAASTSQRRFRGWFLRMTGASSPAVPVGLTVAAITAVVAVAIGLGFRDVVPPPGESSPTASPDESASPSPDAASGYRWFRDEALGYEVLVPTSWAEREVPYPLESLEGFHRFGFAHNDAGPSSFGAFAISVGAGDGTVQVCEPAMCREVVVNSIEELDEAVVTGITTPQRNAIREDRRELTVAGEPGLWKMVSLMGGFIEAGPAFHQVIAMHEGRPIILTFDIYGMGLWHETRNREWIERIVDSFHFLDEGASDPPPGTTGLAVPGTPLSFTVTGDWAACSRSDVPFAADQGFVYRTQDGCHDVAEQPYWVGVPMAPSITVRLGAGGEHPSYCVGDESDCAFESTGECNGSFGIPGHLLCEDLPISGLADLWSAVRVDDVEQLADSQQRDVMIDGREARLVTVSRDYREGTIIVDRTWVLVMDDRPYVIILSGPRDSMPEGWQEAVIASMTFSD